MDAFSLVVGALGGLVATAAMIPIELVVRTRYGLDGLLDWRLNQTSAARFTHRSVESSVLPGLGLHFIHGLFQGIFLVLVLLVLPVQPPGWLTGIAFGGFLFALTLLLYKPVARRSIRSSPHADVAVGVSLATHLVYGVVLALLVLGL